MLGQIRTQMTTYFQRNSPVLPEDTSSVSTRSNSPQSTTETPAPPSTPERLIYSTYSRHPSQRLSATIHPTPLRIYTPEIQASIATSKNNINDFFTTIEPKDLANTALISASFLELCTVAPWIAVNTPPDIVTKETSKFAIYFKKMFIKAIGKDIQNTLTIKGGNDTETAETRQAIQTALEPHISQVGEHNPWAGLWIHTIFAVLLQNNDIPEDCKTHVYTQLRDTTRSEVLRTLTGNKKKPWTTCHALQQPEQRTHLTATLRRVLFTSRNSKDRHDTREIQNFKRALFSRFLENQFDVTNDELYYFKNFDSPIRPPKPAGNHALKFH